MNVWFHAREHVTESVIHRPTLALAVHAKGREAYDALREGYYRYYRDTALRLPLVLTFDELEEYLLWNELGVKS